MADKSVMNTKTALVESWQKKLAEIRRLEDSPRKSDQERVQKLKGDIEDIQSEIRLKDMGRVGDVVGGAVSGGLNATVGLVGLAGVPLANKLFGLNMPTPLEATKKAVGKYLPMEPTEPDNATSRGLFGGVEGLTSGLVSPGSKEVRAIMGGVGGAAGAVDGATGSNVALPATLLAAGTYGGLRGARQGQRKETIEQLMGGMSAQDRAMLKELTVGQAGGIRNPVAIAAEQRLAKDPKFAEIFQLIKNRQADTTQAGLKAIAPQTSTVTAENFAPQVHKAFDKEVARLSNKLNSDNAKWFGKAFEAIDPMKPAFKMDKTLANIDEKIKDFAEIGTDSSKATVAFLERFKKELVANPQGASLTALQGRLKAFGADAARDEGMLAGVALNDQKRVASAIFSGLKDDLAAAKSAADPEVARAARFLDIARGKTKTNYETLNQFVERKLPASLVDKPIEALTSEQLLTTLKKLPPSQRVGTMQVLDSYNPDLTNKVRQSLYDDLLKPVSGVQDGVSNFSLTELVKRYDDAVAKDPTLYKFVLGDKATDLKERVDYARKLIRTSDVNPADPGDVGKKVLGAVIDTAGAVGGAQTKYVGQGGAKLIDILKGKTLDDMDLAKLLLAPEGKEFLKTAAMTPSSAKTLQALEKMRSAENPLILGKEIAANAAVQGAGKAADLMSDKQPNVSVDEEAGSTVAMEEPEFNLVTDDAPGMMNAVDTAPQQEMELNLVIE